MKRLALLLLVFVASCRSVTPVQKIRPTWSPDVSRLVLLNGKVVQFNGDLGWYDKQAAIIEGMTQDSQHVQYPLREIARVETVRSYEIAIAAFTALIPLALGLYLLYKLISLV
jgi:hypothetical protein